MDRQQATELFTLITTVRHVEEMKQSIPMSSSPESTPGCLLCEGVRHGLYEQWDGRRLDFSDGFGIHFGCTKDEARSVLFHPGSPDTTGEKYYQFGKELIEKYGLWDYVSETTLSFADLMDELKQTQLTRV